VVLAAVARGPFCSYVEVDEQIEVMNEHEQLCCGAVLHYPPLRSAVNLSIIVTDALSQYIVQVSILTAPWLLSSRTAIVLYLRIVYA